MAALDFPTSPTVGQVFTGGNGVIYTWNGTLWLATAGGTFPVGTVVDFAGAAAPSGWYICDGASKSTTTDAGLFAVIGYTFGGSGASFLLPDLRGRVTAGPDPTNVRIVTRAPGFLAGTAVLGAAAGEAGHVMDTSDLSTNVLTASATGPGYGMTFSGASILYFAPGGSQSNVTQPTLILNKIIKF